MPIYPRGVPRSLAAKILRTLVGALIFCSIAWASFFPGQLKPDATHSVSVKWQGGYTTYRTPEENLWFEIVFKSGLIGVVVLIVFELLHRPHKPPNNGPPGAK